MSSRRATGESVSRGAVSASPPRGVSASAASRSSAANSCARKSPRSRSAPFAMRSVSRRCRVGVRRLAYQPRPRRGPCNRRVPDSAAQRRAHRRHRNGRNRTSRSVSPEVASAIASRPASSTSSISSTSSKPKPKPPVTGASPTGSRVLFSSSSMSSATCRSQRLLALQARRMMPHITTSGGKITCRSGVRTRRRMTVGAARHARAAPIDDEYASAPTQHARCPYSCA